MERIILALCLLISSVVSAQPGYTSINSRYKWIAGGFDSSLILPRYNGVPSGLRSAWNTDGQLAVDTANNRLYVYSGGAWVRVANYSDVGSAYTFPYSVVAPGDAIQLENDTAATVTNYFYGTNSVGRRTWLPQSLLTYTASEGLTMVGNDVQLDDGSNPLTRDVVIDADGYGFSVQNAGSFYLDFLNSGVRGLVGEGEYRTGKPGMWLIASSSVDKFSRIIVNPDTIFNHPYKGNYIIDTLNSTSSTTGKKIVLRDTVTGLVENIDPALIGGGGSGSVTANNGLVVDANGRLGLDSAGVNPLVRDVLIDGGGFDFTIDNLLGYYVNSTSEISLFSNNGTVQGSFDIDVSGNASIYSRLSADPNNKSELVLYPDSTVLDIINGDFRVKNLQSGTSTDSVLVWTASDGQVKMRNAADIVDTTVISTILQVQHRIDSLAGTISGGDVYKVGTPVDNQVGVWTGDGTLEGNADLTYDGTALSVTTSSTNVPSLKVGTGSGNAAISIMNPTLTTEYGNIGYVGSSLRMIATNRNITILNNGTGGIKVTSTGGAVELQGASGVVVNEAGADDDFRVEGDANQNLIFADASADKVGIGTATPDSLLHVAGGLKVTGGINANALPTAPGVYAVRVDASGNFSKADTTTGGSGVSAIGTINSETKSANGAVISGTDLVMQTVDATYPGLMTSALKLKLDSLYDGDVQDSVAYNTITGAGLYDSVYVYVYNFPDYVTYDSTLVALITKVTASSTTTFTNKRWTARVGSTTSSATPTINTDNVDIYKLTAQTVDISNASTNLTGSPNDGDIFEYQITGTATRNITWGTSFVSSTVTLPAATSSTATLTVIFQYYTTSSYGNNKWVCVNSY